MAALLKTIWMITFRFKMIRNKKHLKFIRQLPCVICNNKFVAAHIRKGTDGGAGLKPSDCYTVPLRPSCHHTQHQQGELYFWYGYGGYEAAIALAKNLYNVTGDIEQGVFEIMEFRNVSNNK